MRTALRNRRWLGAALLSAGTLLTVLGNPAPAAANVNEQGYSAQVVCGSNGGEHRWTTREDAVARARSWVGKTPYSQNNCYSNKYGTYRTDCSGMVSMAWGLGGDGAGFWTGNLDDVSTPIPAADLQPGDALLYHDGTSNGSHVALFVRWIDAAHTRVWVIQETGSADNTIEGEPENFNWRNYTPIRYDRIHDGKAGSSAFQHAGQTHYVDRSVSDNVDHHWYTAGHGWSRETLPGSAAGHTVGLTWERGTARQGHLFARSASGSLSHWWDGSGWSYESVAGQFVGDPGATTFRDQLYAFGRTATNDLRMWAQAPGTAWGSVVLSAGAGNLVSNPTALSRHGQLHVFGRSANSGLAHWWYAPGDVWRFETYGSGLYSDPAVVVSGEQIHVFGRSGSDTLNHWWQGIGTGWLQENLGGNIVGDPATTKWVDQVHVYGTSSFNNLEHWWDGAGWSRENLGGTILGDPAAAIWREQNHAFGRSTNNNLRHWFYLPGSSGWGAETLTGSLHA